MDYRVGLTQFEVNKRIERGEVNRMKTTTSRSIADIIRANIFTLFNSIILSAMVLVLLTGSWKDAVFGVVIIINTAIGVFTEVKSKITLDKLSILVAAQHTVRRDGQDVQINHDEIVLDDIVMIQSGDQVPADGEVIEDYGVELDESMLTGESRTVKKKPGDTVYSGATVVSGSALMRVTAVGEKSYAAKLTQEAKVYKRTHSDINDGINKILRFMIIIVVPLCALLIWSQMRVMGGWNTAIANGSWREAVVQAVAGIGGLIPEGLVLLTSLNFALAALRLARQNTLVQELDAVETLARVDALNLDKTGTITDGGIALDEIHILEHASYSEKQIREALRHVSNEEHPNATATAILEGLRNNHAENQQVKARVPFSSARKWSSVVLDNGQQWFVGAPEIIMSALSSVADGIREHVNSFANSGARVLVLAAADGAVEGETINANAVIQALVVCSESVRSDAAETLAWFREQGVRARVISGDNPRTVAAIAQKVKLTGDAEPRFIDARDLPQTAEEVAQVLEDVDVVGRVLPEQKKLIVQALHSQGHTVAMTGDGVNDALALKEADLGIAMGNAAPATKAVAQVILVDSLFSHLPSVVARGRQVMANMERVASLFLVKTTYSAIISVGVVLFALNFPYLPRHMTYIGWFTIGTPAFLLALAPNTRRYIPGFLQRVIHTAVPAGLVTGVSVLASTFFVPKIMGWNNVAEHMTQLRTINVCVLFVLGILMLASIAQPLTSWRGWLVAFFAVAGVVGACIPFVAQFFELHLPTGQLIPVTALVVVCAIGLWFVVCYVTDLLWRARGE